MNALSNTYLTGMGRLLVVMDGDLAPSLGGTEKISRTKIFRMTCFWKKCPF